MLAHPRELVGGVLVGAEVGDEQRVRLPVGDAPEAGLPHIEVDVGRRRRGQDEALGADPHPRGVADERHPARAVEEADVMGRVPRRVRDLELPVAHREALAPGEDVHVPLGHRQELAPQPVHVVAVEPARAVQQLRGVHHVRRPRLVHVDGDVGVLAHEGAGGPGVVEVDVGEENRPDVGRRDALLAERRAQGVEARRRAGVDEGGPAGVLEDGGGDDPGLAEEVQVGIGDAARDRWHGSGILLCPAGREPAAKGPRHSNRPGRTRSSPPACPPGRREASGAALGRRPP